LGRWQGLYVISGYRSPDLQARINPLVPDSLHTRCPSLAVDLRVGNRPASLTDVDVWEWLGAEWERRGFRFGGHFKDPDVNHFDLGGIEATEPLPKLGRPR
jgi:hypothetical protein